jgi:hypothetical protein
MSITKQDALDYHAGARPGRRVALWRRAALRFNPGASFSTQLSGSGRSARVLFANGHHAL